MTAAMALLGQLPGPPSKANQGACGVLGGDVFAYAVSSSVVVLDVSAADLASCNTLAANPMTLHSQVLPQRQLAHLQSTNLAHQPRSWLQVKTLQLAVVLQGPHRSSAVSAISWWVAQTVDASQTLLQTITI